MPPRLSPDLVDPRFYDHLGEMPEELFGERLYRSVELVDRHAREWAVALAHELALAPALERAGEDGTTVSELARASGVAPGFEEPLAWILEELASEGAVAAVAIRDRPPGRANHRYRAVQAFREPHCAQVRAEALAHDPANEPFFDLLDLAGEAWPRVVRGESRGEDALLGPAQMGLWTRYFSNDNPVYAINNRLAAVATANRLPAGVAARVLEIGAGAGSASLALFEELERRGRMADLESYRLTEPAALLRRRAERELGRSWPGAPIAAAALDVDRPWGEQGVPSASQDVVYGVNVFHVAQDLPFTLGEALAALAPGGWVIVGECLRPHPGSPLAVEMIFLLLEGLREVSTDPELRPGAGFLSAELWIENLERVGFDEVRVVPDVPQLVRYHPGFVTGVICGRRPA